MCKQQTRESRLEREATGHYCDALLYNDMHGLKNLIERLELYAPILLCFSDQYELIYE